MHNEHPGRVEDYTNANLVLIFVNLLWVLVWIWSAWGPGAVIIVAALLNHMITRLALSRRRRQAGVTRA